jgi:hypothetical protein
VTSGACTVASSATCFRSPNYPSEYRNNQRCTITVSAHSHVKLSVNSFWLEWGYAEYGSCYSDWVSVNGVKYCGNFGPEGVYVAAGSTIKFKSDNSGRRSGFEICGASPESLPELTRMKWVYVERWPGVALGARRMVLHRVVALQTIQLTGGVGNCACSVGPRSSLRAHKLLLRRSGVSATARTGVSAAAQHTAVHTPCLRGADHV